jgi:hypothetical protein
MSDTSISALTALAGANIADGDEFVIVDKSDTTMAGTGTDKKTTAADVIAKVVAAASLAELIRDTIGTALVEGAGIDVTVNDAGDTITIATTITQYTDEMARDALGAALTGGTAVTVTPNDGSDTITIAVTDAELVALAGLTSAADRVPYFTGSGTAALATFTSAARTLLAAVDDAAQRTALGLGTMAVETASNYVTKALYDAQTVLAATSDNTPAAVTVGEQTVVGRVTGGNVTALTAAQLASILSGVDAGGMTLQDVGAVEYRVNTVGASGAAETLDTAVYSVHKVTMDQNCTFTFSNPAPSGELSCFLLFLSGAFTPTFPAAVDWADATPPTYGTPTLYGFYTLDNGTTWIGVSLGKSFG